jgi:hypothetical protein
MFKNKREEGKKWEKGRNKKINWYNNVKMQWL